MFFFCLSPRIVPVHLRSFFKLLSHFSSPSFTSPLFSLTHSRNLFNGLDSTSSWQGHGEVMAKVTSAAARTEQVFYQVGNLRTVTVRLLQCAADETLPYKPVQVIINHF